MRKIRISALYKPTGIERDILLILNDEGRILEKTKFDGITNDYTFLDGIVFPTLVNAHTHIELTEFENVGNIGNLWDWILLVVKNKRNFQEEKFKNSISHGENFFLNQGVCCIGDVRSVLPEGPYFSCTSGRIFFEVLGYSEEILQAKLKAMETFLTSCNIDKGISIHSLYTTPFSVASDLIKMAEKKGLPVMIHLGETKFESELFFQKDVNGFKKIFPDCEFERIDISSYGDIIEKLNFNENTVLVHCVEFTKKDFDIVKKEGISVVLCPCSNLYWGENLPDFRYIMDREINFAVGTDSPLTNGIMNLREDANLILKNVNYEKKYYKKIFDALTYLGRKVLKISSTGLNKNELFRALFIPNIYTEERLYDAFFNGSKIFLIQSDTKNGQIFKKQV